MRLVTLAVGDDPGAATRAAVLRGTGGAVPIDAYADAGALLRAGDLAAAHRALEGDAPALAYDDAALRRPVLRPDAVACVGLNYAAHIREMGRDLPVAPTWFSKLSRALTDPYADVVIPEGADRMDYEGELAVVIGRAGRAIPAARAWDHVAGLTVANDVTSRALQRRGAQWFAGKTLQASTPVGPALVTVDELGGPDGLADRELRVDVDGQERQRAPLGDLVFDIPALVADLSRWVELLPGDLLLTGTPGGVGDAEERYLGDGETVTVAIDGLGAVRTTMRATAEAGS